MEVDIDFEVIGKEPVGYVLEGEQVLDDVHSVTRISYRLRRLTFEDFIPPYVHGARTPQEVYNNLKNTLGGLIYEQEGQVDRERGVMLDVVASSALMKEAIRNSMGLIGEYCLKEKPQC